MLTNRVHINFFLFCLFLFSFEGVARESVVPVQQVKPWDEGLVDYRHPPYDQIEAWKNMSRYKYDRETRPVGFWRILWNYILRWISSISQAGNWLMVLGIFLGVGLMFVLIVRIFHIPVSGLFFISGNGNKGDLRFADNHQDLSNQKLEEMLEMYRNNKAYRESVRILFLLYLQQLQRRGLVRLKSFKTNQEYLKEISNPGERDLFKKRMGLFDHVWYGQASVSEEKYLRVEQAFGGYKGMEGAL